MLKCGLIGNPLGHSYSPMIHSLLSKEYTYDLFELKEDELESFIRAGDFDGVNVTIPYKVKIMDYLDIISDKAKRIGSVNTVVRKNGKLYGYNTDYYGFETLLVKSGVDISNKKVLVLGSGGASRTVKTVLEDKGAGEIITVSRSGENNYSNIAVHSDCKILVNTTPVGMYPDSYSSPVDLSVFEKLECVIDIIFNPSKTSLMMNAEKKAIKAFGGLTMLVAQAKAASDLFTGRNGNDFAVDRIEKKISKRMKNIILIGMPGVGKSTIGRFLSERTGRPFYDIDSEIEKEEGRSIPEIFKNDGEEYFRKIETDILLKHAKKSGVIISPGGGAVLSQKNRDAMRQNGTIIFLTKDLEKLSRRGRPISMSRPIEDIYNERLPIYRELADMTFELLETPYRSTNALIKKMEML